MCDHHKYQSLCLLLNFQRARCQEIEHSGALTAPDPAIFPPPALPLLCPGNLVLLARTLAAWHISTPSHCQSGFLSICRTRQCALCALPCPHTNSHHQPPSTPSRRLGQTQRVGLHPAGQLCNPACAGHVTRARPPALPPATQRRTGRHVA
jgi:hypothetical protein